MIVTKGISNTITIVALSATMLYCASVGDIKLSSIIATGLLGYIGGIENKSSKRVEEREPIHSEPISLERKSTFHSVNPEPITTTIGVKQMLPTSKESINNTLAVIVRDDDLLCSLRRYESCVDYFQRSAWIYRW